MLAAVGRIVHHKADPSSVSPPPTVPGLDQLLLRRGRLRPLSNAVAWSLWTRPEDAGKVVRWLGNQLPIVEALFDPDFGRMVGFEPIIPAMEVTSAAGADGIDDAGALLQALALPEIDIETRFRTATRHVEELRPSKQSVAALRAGRITIPGRTEARSEVLEFISRWAQWATPRRRATAHVWRLVFDAGLFERWASWWDDVGQIRDTLQNFKVLERTLADPVATQAAIEKQLLSRLEGPRIRRTPTTFVVSDMLEALTQLSESPELMRSARRALDIVPPTWAEMPTHQAFVLHWEILLQDHTSQRIRRHLDAFRRLIATGGERALAPWALFFRDAHTGDFVIWTPDEYALEWQTNQRIDSVPMVRASVEISAVPLVPNPFVYCLCLLGAEVTMALAAVEWALAHGLSIREFDLTLEEPLRHALSIAPDAESLGRILLRLDRLTDSEPPELLLIGAQQLTGQPGTSSERALAWGVVDRIERDPSVLVDLGRRRRLVGQLLAQATNGRLGEESEWQGTTDRAWVDGYPAQLRRELHLLADYDPESEATARKLLRRDVRDLRSLERELDAVVERATQADDEDERRELNARRDKLEAWIRQPQVLAEGKLSRLRHKLRRAAVSSKLADARARADQRISNALQHLSAKLLGQSPPTFDPILEPEVVLLLAAVATLSDKGARRFGLELLLRRCGPPPWDLREHPDNLRFRRRMQEAGIDLNPWIDGAFGRTYESANGQRLTLALERDPILVLRMGAPFGTCLSPWDFNFFSAVTNAVDLDKQVVYARDAKGRIQGRCLLAIGQTAGADALIAFFPYAHDESLGFRDLMSRYSEELAEAMGLPRASKGRVSPLVCPNWYDDGPHDLSGDLDFLDEGQPFRESLTELEPDALASELVQAAPRAVDAHIIAALLVRIHSRPELVSALAQWIDRLRLPAIDRLRAASLARRAGRDDLARRWLEMSAGHLRGHSDFPWWNRELGEVLADLVPSLALRLLRETRPKGIRSWSQERNVHRLWIAGQAHLSLHRKKKAVELFERITSGWRLPGTRAVIDKAHRAISALEA